MQTGFPGFVWAPDKSVEILIAKMNTKASPPPHPHPLYNGAQSNVFRSQRQKTRTSSLFSFHGRQTRATMEEKPYNMKELALSLLCLLTVCAFSSRAIVVLHLDNILIWSFLECRFLLQLRHSYIKCLPFQIRAENNTLYGRKTDRQTDIQSLLLTDSLTD